MAGSNRDEATEREAWLENAGIFIAGRYWRRINVARREGKDELAGPAK